MYIIYRALEMEYVDLYLVHFPARLKGEKGFVFSGEDVLPLDMRGTWDAMEECCRLGLAKAIGVSNFSCKKLEQLLSRAKIVPAVNQVRVRFLVICLNLSHTIILLNFILRFQVFGRQNSCFFFPSCFVPFVVCLC